MSCNVDLCFSSLPSLNIRHVAHDTSLPLPDSSLEALWDIITVPLEQWGLFWKCLGGSLNLMNGVGTSDDFPTLSPPTLLLLNIE